MYVYISFCYYIYLLLLYISRFNSSGEHCVSISGANVVYCQSISRGTVIMRTTLYKATHFKCKAILSPFSSLSLFSICNPLMSLYLSSLNL